jgi:hypothetical protein
MKLYLADNFKIQMERTIPFLRACKNKIINFIFCCRKKCLQIFKEDIAFFVGLSHIIKKERNHSLLLIIIFVFISSAILVYRNGNSILATLLFIPGFTIYFFALWRFKRKIGAEKTYYTGKYVVRKSVFKMLQRKTKVKTSPHHDFNPISLGTLHFSVALSLWSDWVTNKMNDERTLAIAIIFSIISVIFFIAVYNKPTRDFMNSQAAPYVISLSFWALLGGFVVGLFEALPDFPQTLLVNRIIVSIAVYFGFAWVVTFLLTMLRDARNELASILVFLFLILVGVAEVIKKDPVNRIEGIALFSIFMIGYLVSTHRIHPYGDVNEK